MPREELWRQRRLEKGDECVVAELRADFSIRDRGPEQAVRGNGVALDELGDPLSVGAANGRVCPDCGSQIFKRSLIGEVLLLQPLQDRPVFEDVVCRRHKRRVLIGRDDE